MICHHSSWDDSCSLVKILSFWLKGSRFKGSEVDSPVTLTKEISGKEKSAKRLTLNREPETF